VLSIRIIPRVKSNGENCDGTVTHYGQEEEEITADGRARETRETRFSSDVRFYHCVRVCVVSFHFTYIYIYMYIMIKMLIFIYII